MKFIKSPLFWIALIIGVLIYTRSQQGHGEQDRKQMELAEVTQEETTIAPIDDLMEPIIIEKNSDNTATTVFIVVSLILLSVLIVFILYKVYTFNIDPLLLQSSAILQSVDDTMRNVQSSTHTLDKHLRPITQKIDSILSNSNDLVEHSNHLIEKQIYPIAGQLERTLSNSNDLLEKQIYPLVETVSDDYEELKPFLETMYNDFKRSTVGGLVLAPQVEQEQTSSWWPSFLNPAAPTSHIA